MNEQMQAMCFMAGANSIFYGCKLLTTANPDEHFDRKLMKKLGLNSEQTKDYSDETKTAALLEQINEQGKPKEKDLFYEA